MSWVGYNYKIPCSGDRRHLSTKFNKRLHQEWIKHYFLELRWDNWEETKQGHKILWRKPAIHVTKTIGAVYQFFGLPFGLAHEDWLLALLDQLPVHLPLGLLTRFHLQQLLLLTFLVVLVKVWEKSDLRNKTPSLPRSYQNNPSDPPPRAPLNIGSFPYPSNHSSAPFESKYCLINTRSMDIFILVLFCSIILPLACTGWVRSTIKLIPLSTLTLSSVLRLMNWATSVKYSWAKIW